MEPQVKYKEDKLKDSALSQEIAQDQESEDPNITSNNPYGPVDFLVKKQQERQEKSYYDEQKRLEKQKRINAFTEALRLLSDTVGYGKGASVVKREPETQIDKSIDGVRQRILANREDGDKATLSLAMQRAKEKEAQAKYDRDKKGLLDNYAQKLATANEYEKGILQQKLDNSLAEIEARHAADMKEIELAQGYQNKRAQNTQAQINSRFNKGLDFKEKNKGQGQKETGLYELTDEQGGTAAKLNQGGLDRMAAEIIKDPTLAKEYDVIVNRYGDGLEKENAKRVFVQKYWNKSPGLKQLGESLNRSASIQSQPIQTVNLTDLDTKLGPALDIIDNEYTKIEQSTIGVNNIPDYTERYRRLYNLLIASKKLTPDEAKAYAQEIVYNE